MERPHGLRAVTDRAERARARRRAPNPPTEEVYTRAEERIAWEQANPVPPPTGGMISIRRLPRLGRRETDIDILFHREGDDSVRMYAWSVDGLPWLERHEDVEMAWDPIWDCEPWFAEMLAEEARRDGLTVEFR